QVVAAAGGSGVEAAGLLKRWLRRGNAGDGRWQRGHCGGSEATVVAAAAMVVGGGGACWWIG
nr:hypothetical protein [Tanacetum cinerariifolium]